MHIRRLFRSALLTSLVLPVTAGAQGQPAAPDTAVRAWIAREQPRILGELAALLRLPNIARDRAAIRANAARIDSLMQARGLAPRLLDDADSTTPPAVYGEWRVPGAKRTLVFYAHYDGQPIAGGWNTDPWTPTLFSERQDRGGQKLDLDAMLRAGALEPQWRLYARSASDDKAGVMAILSAVDALRATGRAPSSNLLFFFEGEEEAGSPHLASMLARHRDLLGAADAWIMLDGPVHQTGRKQVVFGARGDVNVDVTVYGPLRPLHSGHYGNWAPNPAMLMAQLLASMKDRNGRVTIPGWYSDLTPLGAEERHALAAAPAPDSMLRAELGLAATEGRTRSLAEAINQPSLNINGVRSGDVGTAARNVIPTSASAVLDLRLVKGNDVKRQVSRLVRHVERQGYHVLDREPTVQERLKWFPIATVTTRPGGYNAERTPMNLPLARSVVAAVQRTSAQPVVRVPTMGGSLPLIVFRDVLGATTLSVPIANYDNNQHAENENLRLGNLWAGIESMAAIMTMR